MALRIVDAQSDHPRRRAPSTSGRRSTRPRSSRINAWVRSWPTSPSSRNNSTCPARPRRRGGAARRTICSRSPASRCAIWKLHAPPSREAGIDRGYPAPDRVTFLNGPNRDFPKRRRHQLRMKDRTAGRNAQGRWDARRPAQSRVFYSFVTACRASKLALRS